ncbi:CheA signal transduction histidine kinase [Calothrix sp. NIES-4071]|nr:CheA signal transduction histidine kinase [Calothrix sp. NIES-4071]BAZ56414.1 CheA signal transduction histidine kinase [Calothrix sp. NIES-4105]
MITDASIREQGYIYFLTEAPELLQTIEEELFSLADNYSTAKVHNLMRATHTLKGGAANVGLDVINKVAHSLEDIFKALYSPDVLIDAQLQTLLFQAYECLQLPVTAEITKTTVDNDDILQRAASVFAQLQEKLGDAFGADVYIPTSEELGFDIVLSIFETGVSQRIDSIAEILHVPPENDELAEFLRSQAEVFLGLAESLNLPGFAAIAQAMVAALDANPDAALEVAKASSESLQKARVDVLAGDRVRGGEPSETLLSLSQVVSYATEEEMYSIDLSNNFPEHLSENAYDNNIIVENQEDISLQPKIEETSRITSSAKESYSLRSEVEKLYNFLTQPNNTQDEPLKAATAKLYLKIIRFILGWFNHELNIPEKELSLSLIIPKRGVKNIADYVENWLSEFWLYLHDEDDTPSLSIYRQGIILNVLLSVAKYKYADVDTSSPIVEFLQNLINQLAQDYKNYPPVTTAEKNWSNSPKLQTLLEIKEVSTAPSEPTQNGIEAIWGEEITHTFSTNIAETAIQNASFYQEEYVPSIAQPADTKLQPNEPIIAKVAEEADIGDTVVNVASAVNAQPEQSILQKSQTASNSNNHRQRSFVRVDVDGLQRLNYLAGELLIYQKRRTLQDEQLQQIIEQLSQHIQRHQATISELRDLPLQMQSHKDQATKKVASIDFDSLEMDDYNEFYMTLHSAQEETLQLQEIAESLDLILRQSTQVHDKNQNLTLNIIDNIVEARMAPLANILNRFPQLVGNLANVYGKKAEVKLFGTQVLVDKAISEKLYDPLLHLVRNAFDHGIETKEVRQKQGKSESGVISIRAYHQGSQTVIEVKDDGQGLNFEKIRKKGIDLGLISDSYHPTEEELLELLFSPGFSTAGQVSEISGRGIGLDIVQTQLQALNGSISVYSLPNQGTTFVLKLPFSMTTDQLMIVQAGGAVYALLLDSIEKILLPSSDQIKEFEGRKVLHWNAGNSGRMVSLRNLSDYLHYSGSFRSGANFNHSTIVQEREEVANPVLVLRRNQDILALEVDQIIGEQELVIRPLNSTIVPPKFVYGCSSLANGNLVLVIDGSLLIETSEMQASLDVMSLSASSGVKKKALPMGATFNAPMLTASSNDSNFSGGAKILPQAKPTNNKNQKVVLVVDDAISLRQTLSLTLQKAGYQVIQAQNGIEAVEQLQHHPEIHLVVSDLEMPRMNGFELLSNVRQNTSLSEKPVIILTSRSAEKHRKLAEALGATAYLTKPYLEHEFIATVDGLMNKQVEGLTHVFVKV